MICKQCEQYRPIENHEKQLCATCNRQERKTNDLYPMARRMFLEMCIKNSIRCPIYDVPITMESDVHHKKGRGEGFADQWAKDNGINITIDPRYFLAVSRLGHQIIEAHPKWAKERGYSLTRHDLII